MVQDITDAEAASRKLIEEAYAKGSSDNITCMVVRFDGQQEMHKVLYYPPCIFLHLRLITLETTITFVLQV